MKLPCLMAWAVILFIAYMVMQPAFGFAFKHASDMVRQWVAPKATSNLQQIIYVGSQAERSSYGVTL
jgi:hypothetical protein